MLLSERPKSVGWVSDPQNEYFYYYRGNNWRRIMIRDGTGFEPLIDEKTGQPVLAGPFTFKEVGGRVRINLEPINRRLPFTPSLLAPGT